MKKEDYRAPNDVQKKIETWWTTKRDSDLAARMGKGPKFWKFSEGTLKIVGSGDFDGCSGIAIVSPHGALVGHFWPQNNTGAPLKIKDFEAQYNNHKSDLAGANVYVFAKEKDDPQDKNIWQEEHFVKFLKEELQTAEPKVILTRWYQLLTMTEWRRLWRQPTLNIARPAPPSTLILMGRRSQHT